MRQPRIVACLALAAAFALSRTERRGGSHACDDADRQHRRGGPRSLHRALHRLLPVRLRRMAQGQPHPGGPVALGAVRRAGGAQSAGAEGRPGEGGRRHGDAAAHRPEDRRPVRELHGRARRRGQGRLCAEGRPGPGRGPQVEERAGRPDRVPPRRGRRRPVPVHVHAGLQGPEDRDRRRRPGGPRATRARLLLQGRRQVRRAADAVRRPRPEDVRAAGRRARQGGRRRQDGHGHRDGPRQGLPRRRRAARPERALPQDDAEGARRPQPELRLGPLRQGGPDASPRERQRGRPRLLQGARGADQDREPRPVEDVPALARRPRRGARPCPRRSSTRTSPSTARRSRAPRSCGRAGSAASRSWTIRSATPSDSATSRPRSAPTARSGCRSWWPISRRPWTRT